MISISNEIHYFYNVANELKLKSYRNALREIERSFENYKISNNLQYITPESEQSIIKNLISEREKLLNSNDSNRPKTDFAKRIINEIYSLMYFVL